MRTTDAEGGVTERPLHDERGNVKREIVFAADGTTVLRMTDYTYDEKDNRLTETVHIDATTTATRRYSYNERGQVVTIIDPRDKTTTNTYDANGNLTSTEDPEGTVTTHTYLANGLLESTTVRSKKDPSFQPDPTRYEYDASGNLMKETDAEGHVTTYTYDANGNRKTQTTTRTTLDGATQTLLTIYEYDNLNRLTKTMFPDNSVTETKYNSIGKQERTIDQRKNQTIYRYDDLGRLERTEYPDGTTERSVYDAEGRRKESFDRADHKTTYDYDNVGRLRMTTYPDNTVTETKYDAAGQVTETINERGYVTKYEYDLAGRRTKVTQLGDPSDLSDDLVTTFTYDLAGNQKTVTDNKGRRTTYDYDDNNRRTLVTYHDTTFEKTEYDPLGRVKKKIDQDQKVTEFEYDDLGRLITVIHHNEGELLRTRYTYDELGNQRTQTDANQPPRTTTFEYDEVGRRVQRILPLGMSETYDYDDAGNLKSKTDFNGKTTTYDYDNVNRLTSKTPDPGLNEPTVSFTYWPSGQRETMTDASGVTTYHYDERDRLEEKVTPQGTLTYTYDEAGNLTSMTSGNTDGVAVTYAYDEHNRLEKVIDHRLSDAETTYTYDDVGNLETFIYPNGVEHRYEYNDLNRLKKLTVSQVATTLTSFMYDLGPAGNRRSVTEHSGRTVSYDYDDLYRLTEEKIENDPAGVNGAIGYDYDNVGNRLSRDSTVPGIANQTFTYDANDRLNTDTYDDNGNTTGSDGNTYDYDFENHLTDQNSGNVTIVYDGDGNRVSKTVGGVTTQYLVDDRNLTGYAQVVEEIVNGTVERVYTYGLDLISQNQSSGISFYGYDGHGSVRFLTDANGTVTDTYDYDAFGNLIASTGNTPNHYLYTGEQLDPNVGFYYLRARYLNAGTGRFWTMDTFGGFLFEPASLHKYLYVQNDPVNQVDYSGNFSITDLLLSVLISGIINSIVGLKAQQTLSSFVTNFAIGALEGALLYGVAGVAIRAFVQFGRLINLAKVGGPVTKFLSKIKPLTPLLPGTNIPSEFVFKTVAGDIVVSSGFVGGSVTGALKHAVDEIIKKAGVGAFKHTALAEALILRELEDAIRLAMLQGLKSGQKIFVRTAYAEWELIFDLSGTLPKLHHALPRIF